ncbi:MAG: phosphoribosylglycinamide formyltransferase [Mycoplasma sp.]
MKIAIFGSGNGSNFQALAEYIIKNKNQYKLVMVICDKPNAYILERAKKLNIQSYLVDYKQHKSKTDAEKSIIDLLVNDEVDYILLAGFMKILSTSFIDKFQNRIINIHPSLLPSYPGIGAIKKAYDNHDEYIGVTTHYVDGGVDTGKIILQDKIKVNYEKSLEEITHEIHKIEHVLYIKTLQKLLQNYEQRD